MVIGTIKVGNGPRGVAVNSDGSRVYVANEDKTVSVINATTNTVIAVVNMISVPFGIAVTPDGKNVYVANMGEFQENISNFDNSVSVIDTATNTVKTTVEVGEMPYAFGQFIGGRSVLKPVFPVADFSASVTSGYAPLDVQFTDRSQNATGWNWDFGDGTSSAFQNPPMHTYNSPGDYVVKLTLSNENVNAFKTATIHVDSDYIVPYIPGRSSSSGGGSPEPSTNIETKELSQTFVTSGNSAKFDF
jgi:YVTN family beta-propeller protein